MLRSFGLLSRLGLAALVAGIVGVGVGLALQPATAPAHAAGPRLHVPVVIPDIARSHDMLGVTEVLENCPEICPNGPSLPPNLPPIELALSPGITRFAVGSCGVAPTTVSVQLRSIGFPCFTDCDRPTPYCGSTQIPITSSLCYPGGKEVSISGPPPAGWEYVLVVRNGTVQLVCQGSPN